MPGAPTPRRRRRSSSSRIPRLSRSNRKASSAGLDWSGSPAPPRRSDRARPGWKGEALLEESASERWSRWTHVEAISLPAG